MPPPGRRDAAPRPVQRVAGQAVTVSRGRVAMACSPASRLMPSTMVWSRTMRHCAAASRRHTCEVVQELIATAPSGMTRRATKTNREAAMSPATMVRGASAKACSADRSCWKPGQKASPYAAALSKARFCEFLPRHRRGGLHHRH